MKNAHKAAEGVEMRWCASQYSSPEERLTRWQEQLSTLVLPIRAAVDPHPSARQNFSGFFRLGRFGQGAYLVVRGSPQRMERKRSELRASRGQWLFASSMIEGDGYLQANDKSLKVRPGQTSFVDSAQPFALEFRCDFTFVSAMLPRSELLAYQSLAPKAHGTLVDPPAGPALHGFLSALATETDQGVADRLYDHFAGLMLSAIEPISGQADADLRMRDSIRSYVLSALSCPELSTVMVAERFGLSTRKVQRLFQAEGTTLMLWVRDQRLQRCARDLVNDENAGKSVSSIAQRWGFGDMSYFSRCFARRFGQSPSRFRGNAGST